MANKITKADIVDQVTEKVDVDQKDVSKVFDLIFEEIKHSLETGNKVELRGFGIFEPRLRKGRESARNPKTGEKLSFSEHYIAAFRAGKELKENIAKLEISDNEN